MKEIPLSLTPELFNRIILCNSQLIKHCVRHRNNEFAIVPIKDINELEKVLREFLNTVKDEVRQAVEEDKSPEFIIPKNVIITLLQYKGYGVELWNFDEVEEYCISYSDFDVLQFLLNHRDNYKYIIEAVEKQINV